MFQKYGSDVVRNLLVDRVNSTAIEYDQARENLKQYDLKEEKKDEQLDPIRQAKRI